MMQIKCFVEYLIQEKVPSVTYCGTDAEHSTHHYVNEEYENREGDLPKVAQDQ
jgi:hypothetical protein